jgi:hypothetical protein
MTASSQALLAVLLGLSLRGDDHYVQEIRTMGAASPARRGEQWVGEQRVWSTNGRTCTIKRFDLGLEWVVNPARNRYLERPLPPPAAKPVPPPQPRLLDAEVGWEALTFEWRLIDTGETEPVDGRACRVLILEGDSDYARRSIRVWVDPDAPVDMARYTRLVRRSSQEPGLLALYESEPLLQRGAILRIRSEEEMPYGRPRVEESRVTVRRTEAPAGQYDLPKDCQKVSSSSELLQ